MSASQPPESLPETAGARAAAAPGIGGGGSRASRWAFGILFALALVLAGAVVWPFRAPLFLALVLASVLHGIHERLTRLFRGRRVAAALGTTLGLLAVIVGPLGAVVGIVAAQGVKGLAFVRDQLGIHSVAELKHGTLSPRAEELLDRALVALHLSRAQIADMAGRAASFAEHGIQRVLGGSSKAVFHTAIMLIAFYFLLLEGDRLRRWLERVSPLEARQTRDLLQEFRAVSRASILGSALAALFQALFATLGFLVTGAPHPLAFGVLTLFASFIPVVGTLLIWLPVVILQWVLGHQVAALVLCGWCLVFVIGAEHVGKPFMLRAILRGGQEMHTGLVFLSLLGGIEMFGLLGLVLGPLVIAFFLAMVRLYERDFRSRRAAEP